MPRASSAIIPSSTATSGSASCLSENWQGLGVLYLCPIKALLNNLEPCLAHYAGLLGCRAALWHGDVGASRKGRLASEPPDLLLTTPESLEGMLVRGSTEPLTLSPERALRSGAKGRQRWSGTVEPQRSA
jgi:ATP-dependent helicase YprA (DUF1998 family)